MSAGIATDNESSSKLRSLIMLETSFVDFGGAAES